MPTIRLTLLRRLFYETPPFFGDLLEENINHVFPGKKDFILFLEETDAQKRTSLAKRLLSRLARESGLFIPFRLLLMMLRAEEQYAPSTATAQYVPQDHFSHLIQLYMLGIYIFTHHKKFHRSLVSYLKQKRISFAQADSLGSDEAVFSDFLFSWRSFVLMHDMGYPCELPPIINNPILGDIRCSYLNLHEMICDETALAFISRMVSWDLLDEQSPSATCESVAPLLFTGRPEKSSTARRLPGMEGEPCNIILDRWRTATRTPFLHGRRFASLADKVRTPKEVLALLVHRRSGIPSLALIPTLEGRHSVYQIEKKVQLSDAELIKLAFESGITPRVGSKHAEYDWQMFFDDYAGHKARLVMSIGKIVNSYLTPESLHCVAQALAFSAPDPLTTITSAGDFLAYEHWVYESLQNWWQGIKQATPMQGTVEHSVVSLCTISVGREIAKQITDYLIKQIDIALAQQFQNEEIQMLELGVHEIVSRAITPVLTDSALLTNITTSIETEVQSRIEVELTRRRVFEDAKNIAARIYDRGTVTPEDIDLVADGELARLLATSLVEVDIHVSTVDALLAQSKLPSLRQLVEGYHPYYIHNGSVDHGLASAISSLHVTAYAENFVSICNTEATTENEKALKAYAAISVCLGDEIGITDMAYRVRALMPEVTRAIAVHNLYPKHLSSFRCNSFRVHLRREPFCFFAMLCDALQSWDRDRRLWQSEANLQYKTSGDRYDIDIVGDVIHIHEHDHGLDVGKRAEAIKSGLESYLSGVKDYIWLDLAQWPDKTQQPSRDYKVSRNEVVHTEYHS